MGSKRWTHSTCAHFLVRKLHNLLTSKHIRHLCPHSGGVLFLSRNLCLKSSPTTDLAEAHALEFIAQYTSVPVPTVHVAFEHKGRVYIVMERIHGANLSHGWHLRTEASKKKILAQLMSMVEEWRVLPPPEGIGVANVEGGPIFDPRLPRQSLWGPFTSVRQFHKELRNGVEEENLTGQALDELHELVSFHDQAPSVPVFTHGDLSSLNVLCRGDEIVGIVDWETAGWLPQYWEYVTAWNVNPQNTFWQQEIDRFLKPWPQALEMEALRRKYFGDF
ncbi:hypothetical protein LTR62_003173 [Meristemomyces frigidus]|uniref:Aminoglycoside phosphotransferase domain-containing protein n=1 Tax=Meristemomyces frigidus TaxID=1508187 RepID=A0AAN7TF89_9PEZI|nr:hypothetical protein LTR62_003173 [Meristemomyces frigidus]